MYSGLQSLAGRAASTGSRAIRTGRESAHRRRPIEVELVVTPPEALLLVADFRITR
jgi:hypothetical protein